jgi:putative transposase
MSSCTKKVDLWAYENNVDVDFSGPGKPTDNFFGRCL